MAPVDIRDPKQLGNIKDFFYFENISRHRVIYTLYEKKSSKLVHAKAPSRNFWFTHP